VKRLIVFDLDGAHGAGLCDDDLPDARPQESD
jgi:hypothetical protein